MMITMKKKKMLFEEERGAEENKYVRRSRMRHKNKKEQGIGGNYIYTQNQGGYVS